MHWALPGVPSLSSLSLDGSFEEFESQPLKTELLEVQLSARAELHEVQDRGVQKSSLLAEAELHEVQLRSS